MNQADSEIYSIKPLELATLLVNLHQAAQHPLIGHGDFLQSLKEITERMNKGTVQIKKTDLESALWACNMLDEVEEFWSPYVQPTRVRKYTEFSRMLDRLKLPYGFKFNRFFNTIDDKRRQR